MHIKITRMVKCGLHALCLLALMPAVLNAEAPNQIELNEAEGVEIANLSVAAKPSQILVSRKLTPGFTGDLLLIPESDNDRVMGFDPVTGDLIDANIIPTDSTNLSTPINAILSASRQSFLVSDQSEDVVLEYSLEGDFMRVFAPSGGVDTDILDNVRGIALRGNGNLLVTVGGGANDDAIAEFDRNGNHLGNFIANGAGGLDSPFDIFERDSDFLVSGITSDDLLSYSKAGVFISELRAIADFPEQISQARNGNILVANFTGTEEGIIELSPDGTQLIGIYDPAGLSNYRGVFELPNNNLLVATSVGVHEINRSGALVETKISGVSPRFIELVRISSEEVCTPIKSENNKVAVICL